MVKANADLGMPSIGILGYCYLFVLWGEEAIILANPGSPER